MTHPAIADLFTSSFQANPHPIYARLRAEAPAHRIIMPGGRAAWLITRYADVRQALANPRLIKNGFLSPTGDNPTIPAEVRDPLSNHMLGADPPRHTRLRRLASRAFTARRIEALRPRITAFTTELLDTLTGTSHVDLLEALAYPLPIRVICELLGVPTSDQSAFRTWSDVITAGVSAGSALPPALIAMRDYLLDLIATKRANPADDLLSALIAARDDGDRLSEDELTSMVFLLLVAGYETTTNLLGNALFLLLTDRSRWEHLHRHPELIPTTVEECLRYEGPLETATFRITTAPISLGDVTIPAGEAVLISLLAANRDPDQFPQANKLDLARADNHHLAFGHGIHYCLGAPLARLEATIALKELLKRYPNLQLSIDADQLHWRPGVLMRGLTQLPVRL